MLCFDWGGWVGGWVDEVLVLFVFGASRVGGWVGGWVGRGAYVPVNLHLVEEGRAGFLHRVPGLVHKTLWVCMNGCMGEFLLLLFLSFPSSAHPPTHPDITESPSPSSTHPPTHPPISTCCCSTSSWRSCTVSV